MSTKYNYIPAFATFAGLAALALLPARAQSSLGEARILRSQPRPTPRTEPRETRFGLMSLKTTEEKPEPKPEPQPEWEIKSEVSLAFTDFQAGGHGWNVPFKVSAEKGIHAFILQTDGFADASAPQKKDGFNDFLLMYQRTLWTEARLPNEDPKAPKQSLNLTVGATIPVGGEVGSKETKERCVLEFSSPFSKQGEVTFDGGVRRSEEAKKAGKNPYSQVLSATITQKLNEKGDKALIAQITSTHPNHASWSTSVTAGYGFTINNKSVTLSVTRGLNAPEKDTAIQVDWGW